LKDGFTEFLRNNKWTIIIVFLGLLITILIFTINFWRTLLLCVILAVCYLMGSLLDQGGRERVKEFFQALFRKNS